MALRKEDFQKKEDVYDSKPTYVNEYPEGLVVAWYTPILTSEEYNNRMEDIKEVTARFMRHVLEVREKSKLVEVNKKEEQENGGRV